MARQWPDDGDCISISNLQLPKPVRAPNIWGDLKEQPALVSVQIQLRQPFSSAASADSLDDSTVHYGQLAKMIRSNSSQPSDLGLEDHQILEAVTEALNVMTRKPRGWIASRTLSKLILPKASAYGAALELHEDISYVSAQERSTSLATRSFIARDLRIMALLGVNEYERRARQPLVVTLKLSWRRAGANMDSLASMEAVFPLERKLTQIIEETAFETLETLAEHTLNHLTPLIRATGVDASFIHLRFEKPSAIAFADAPVIEVRRLLS